MMMYGVIWLVLVALSCNQCYVEGFTSSRLVWSSLTSSASPRHCPSPRTTSTSTTCSMTSTTVQSSGSEFFYSQKTFDQIGVNAKMQAILSSLQITRPSKVQALSFPTLYNDTIKSCLLGDQTGSGKTLAYLLPILQKMEDKQQHKLIEAPRPYSPQVLILTPTTELALQVSKQVKLFANSMKFRSSCYISSSDDDAEEKKLRLGVEVLVSTPGKIVELMKRKDLYLHDVQHIVFDEVDVLFSEKTFPLRQIGEVLPSFCQFIFTSATLPKEVIQQILIDFPTLNILKGPGLHRISPSIEEVLIDCSGNRDQTRSMEQVFENKRLALLQTLEQHPHIERTLIFCNTIDQCRRVENILQRNDRQDKLRKVLMHHAAIEPKNREENLFEFSKALLPKPVLLICTDRASRGMDFNRAYVDHVILFDFPAEPSEYIRRVGRTGRAGRSGKATVFVYGRQVDAAKAVIRASIEGKKIDPSQEVFDNEEEDEKEDEKQSQRGRPGTGRRGGSSRSSGPSSGRSSRPSSSSRSSRPGRR